MLKNHHYNLIDHIVIEKEIITFVKIINKYDKDLNLIKYLNYLFSNFLSLIIFSVEKLINLY